MRLHYVVPWKVSDEARAHLCLTSNASPCCLAAKKRENLHKMSVTPLMSNFKRCVFPTTVTQTLLVWTWVSCNSSTAVKTWAFYPSQSAQERHRVKLCQRVAGTSGVQAEPPRAGCAGPHPDDIHVRPSWLWHTQVWFSSAFWACRAHLDPTLCLFLLWGGGRRKVHWAIAVPGQQWCCKVISGSIS